MQRTGLYTPSFLEKFATLPVVKGKSHLLEAACEPFSAS
jgi:hypothetical protein